MNLLALLNDPGVKALEKRKRLVDSLCSGKTTLSDLQALDGLNERNQGLILEALEAVSKDHPALADEEWISYSVSFLESPSGGIKREASRIVGNLAHRFPEKLDLAIEKLLQNSHDKGTVLRWSSAYALGRIVALPTYAQSILFEQLTEISENETENGVKNQYLMGLKKASKLRK